MWHSWQSGHFRYPENLGSNPAIVDFYWTYLLLTVCRKDEKKRKEAENGPFLKKPTWNCPLLKVVLLTKELKAKSFVNFFHNLGNWKLKLIHLNELKFLSRRRRLLFMKQLICCRIIFSSKVVIERENEMNKRELNK